MIIDAKDLIVGRLATFVAKQALLGNEVRIINSEKAVVSGKKKMVFDEALYWVERGTPRKGPFIHRSPERLLRRIIRGMLPHDKAKGREAYKRVLCYIDVPDEFKDKKAITVEGANKSKLPGLKFVTMHDIAKRIGAKIE
ncbi:MAG: 50S ribosomal protein L13 [archaeon]